MVDLSQYDSESLLEARRNYERELTVSFVQWLCKQQPRGKLDVELRREFDDHRRDLMRKINDVDNALQLTVSITAF